MTEIGLSQLITRRGLPPMSNSGSNGSRRLAIPRITWVSSRATSSPPVSRWYASHHHTADGLNQPYQYSYLFAYSIQMPQGAQTLTLPDNDKIRILAVSVAEENPELSQAQPLYDTLNRTEPPTAASSSSGSSQR